VSDKIKNYEKIQLFYFRINPAHAFFSGHFAVSQTSTALEKYHFNHLPTLDNDSK
jgi:hypothetical protein